MRTKPSHGRGDIVFLIATRHLIVIVEICNFSFNIFDKFTKLVLLYFLE